MGIPLSIAVQLLPTPQAHDSQGGKTPEQVAAMRARGHGVSNLNETVDLLPTPRTRGDAKTSDRARELYSSSDSMGDVIETLPLLPTPRAARGASSTEIAKALGADITYEGDEQGNVDIPPAFATTSVEEYEALWDALDDQSPYWVTTEGKDYWQAIQRWTRILGRPAPAPSIPDGKNNRHRLSAKFPEWMMGLPEGWVTGPEIGLTRNAALKAIGNGVITQQAYRALEIGWARIIEPLAVAA
jgi:DNA (cytosine-5)-methyltransferase 1